MSDYCVNIKYTLLHEAFHSVRVLYTTRFCAKQLTTVKKNKKNSYKRQSDSQKLILFIIIFRC